MNKNALYILIMYLLSWAVAFVENNNVKGYLLGVGLMLLFPMMLTSKCEHKEETVEEKEIEVSV